MVALAWSLAVAALVHPLATGSPASTGGPICSRTFREPALALSLVAAASMAPSRRRDRVRARPARPLAGLGPFDLLLAETRSLSIPGVLNGSGSSRRTSSWIISMARA